MSQESTTPDLEERGQRLADAMNARDFDAALSYFAPNAVFESVGIGVFEGRAAIRAFLEDWNGAFEDYGLELQGVRDLGNDVAFAVLIQRGRLPGSNGWLQVRYGGVTTWAHGLIERATYYADIDEARAAAERLAEERAQPDV